VAHTAAPPIAVVLAAPFVHVWPAVHAALAPVSPAPAPKPPGHEHAAVFAVPAVFAHTAMQQAALSAGKAHGAAAQAVVAPTLGSKPVPQSVVVTALAVPPLVFLSHVATAVQQAVLSAGKAHGAAAQAVVAPTVAKKPVPQSALVTALAVVPSVFMSHFPTAEDCPAQERAIKTVIARCRFCIVKQHVQCFGAEDWPREEQ